MTIAELHAYGAVTRIALALENLNKNLGRIATALECLADLAPEIEIAKTEGAAE